MSKMNGYFMDKQEEAYQAGYALLALRQLLLLGMGDEPAKLYLSGGHIN